MWDPESYNFVDVHFDGPHPSWYPPPPDGDVILCIKYVGRWSRLRILCVAGGI